MPRPQSKQLMQGLASPSKKMSVMDQLKALNQNKPFKPFPDSKQEPVPADLHQEYLIKS